MILIWSYLLVYYWWFIAKNNMFEYTHTHSKNFKYFAWPKIHPRLLPLANGKLLLSVIRRPGIWSFIATDSISQMFYNYRHNCFIIIISDYHLSINSQLLHNYYGLPDALASGRLLQIRFHKSLGPSLVRFETKAFKLFALLWFLFNHMFMPVLWQYINTRNKKHKKDKTK